MGSEGWAFPTATCRGSPGTEPPPCLSVGLVPTWNRPAPAPILCAEFVLTQKTPGDPASRLQGSRPGHSGGFRLCSSQGWRCLGLQEGIYWCSSGQCTV